MSSRTHREHPCLCTVSSQPYYCARCSELPDNHVRVDHRSGNLTVVSSASLCQCQLHWILLSDRGDGIGLGVCQSCFADWNRAPIGRQLQSLILYLDYASQVNRRRATDATQSSISLESEVVGYEIQDRTGRRNEFLTSTVVDDREGLQIRVRRPRGEQHVPEHLTPGEATFVEWGPVFGQPDQPVGRSSRVCPTCRAPPDTVCTCPQ